jgi:diacylglycerol O-acyltransferase / wax synthase
VMSYRDHMDFGIVSDRDQIDDVWPLLESCKRALDEFEAAVLSAGGAKRNGRAPRAVRSPA